MRIFSVILAISSLVPFYGIASAPFSIKLDLEKSRANTLYVNAVLSDTVSARFMIDTGSSVVVMNHETFEKLRKSGSEITETTQMGARLASGRIKLVKRYLIKSLSLGEACQFHDVEVAVMSNSKNILGMSLLSAASPIAIFDKPAQLALSKCGEHEDLSPEYYSSNFSPQAAGK